MQANAESFRCMVHGTLILGLIFVFKSLIIFVTYFVNYSQKRAFNSNDLDLEICRGGGAT